ncbi:hypothetical protein [Paenarthrobacter sp. NPDC058040]|uniref:hypothetical protein n=1 Tax=unclassified Paenarthrobacter TaxID=2634190 RepID=UPI0036D9C10C
MDHQPRGTIPAGIVGTAAAGSAAAHVLAAVAGPAGHMAWLMAAMGVACLACVGPMLRGRNCAGLWRAGWNLDRRNREQPAGGRATRAASHLLAMSAVMILIHLVLLAAPGFMAGSGAGAHHGGAGGESSSAHGVTMLALIAVELACLMGASAALRLSRRTPDLSSPDLTPSTRT